MNLKAIILFLVLLLCNFHLVFGLEITSYSIVAAPKNGVVENVIEITVYNNDTIAIDKGTLNFAIDTEINNIQDSYGHLKYTPWISDEKQKINFTFTVPIKIGETRILTMQTTTHNIIEKSGYFEYILVLVPTQNIESFTHILLLENDASLYLLFKEGTYLLVPDATVSKTEDSIIIEWKTKLSAHSPSIFLARFNQDRGTRWWLLMIIILSALLFGIIVGVIGNAAIRKYKQKKVLNAAKLMNIKEKAVLEYVITNVYVKQYDLTKKLNYTKSNISKIIKRLELRGLVEVKRDGKVKIISIGEKIKNEF